MRTKVLTGLSLILFVVTGFVVATSERDDNVAKAAERSANAAAARSAARGSQRAGREQMYKGLLEKRSEQHKAAMKELEDIKKLADEEGATKTAAALQKMIDKKNAEFKQSMERFETARRGRAEQVKAREKKADDNDSDGDND